jgi:hypothetical protein
MIVSTTDTSEYIRIAGVKLTRLLSDSPVFASVQISPISVTLLIHGEDEKEENLRFKKTFVFDFRQPVEVFVTSVTRFLFDEIFPKLSFVKNGEEQTWTIVKVDDRPGQVRFLLKKTFESKTLDVFSVKIPFIVFYKKFLSGTPPRELWDFFAEKSYYLYTTETSVKERKKNG